MIRQFRDSNSQQYYMCVVGELENQGVFDGNHLGKIEEIRDLYVCILKSNISKFKYYLLKQYFQMTVFAFNYCLKCFRVFFLRTTGVQSITVYKRPSYPRIIYHIILKHSSNLALSKSKIQTNRLYSRKRSHSEPINHLCNDAN